MIISKVFGGLGNQMFQLAAGKALAFKYSSELILDFENISEKKEKLTPREFELSIFDKGDFKLLKKSDRAKLLAEELSLSRKILNKIVRQQICQYYRQPSFNYDGNFSSIPDNAYLIGYFQSEKFFSPFEEEIRKSFEFPESISDRNKEISEKIKNSNSVSVHVRRGDYVKVASNLAHHGLCSETYYNAAFAEVKNKVENPVFYFFSDDIDWVKTNFSTGTTAHYISHNTGDQSFEDMRLMSHCKHHIIANSSFSWWGAWLNPSKDKMVIAPKPWFDNPKKEEQTVDLIPNNWIRIQK